MSELIWRPTAEYLDGSNLSRFMARYGIGSYEEMVRRSVEDVAWYWSQVERDLGLEWDRPYERVLDTHQGIEWATWFAGGLINIAHNCVDRHAAGDAAERTAVIEEREDGSVRSLTYRDLAAEVGRLANGLRSIGIAKGDRVGVYLPMCVESVVSMMAIAKIGAVYLPIFSGFAPAAVAARLEDAGAKALISADGYTHRGRLVEMKEAADEAAHMIHLHTTLILRHVGRPVEWHRKHDVVWDELLAEQPAEAPTEPTEAEDVWMIAYTSGTTGKPKGAVHVHGGFLVKVAAEVAYQVDCKPGDVLHWVTDMGWIMGPWETVGTLALGG
ncbi:MAG: acyl-CoA synthetase/AMP-acid ligase, partial [Actinobacteria bacterium]|nr:acyl-CoA synthetase/AMP-acid ligase [Actinomycetota bacterium]